MQNRAITVTDTGRVDGNEPLCLVAIASLPYHNQGGELIEALGVYPEGIAWEIAALCSRERGLAVTGPRSPVTPRRPSLMIISVTPARS